MHGQSLSLFKALWQVCFCSIALCALPCALIQWVCHNLIPAISGHKDIDMLKCLPSTRRVFIPKKFQMFVHRSDTVRSFEFQSKCYHFYLQTYSKLNI